MGGGIGLQTLPSWECLPNMNEVLLIPGSAHKCEPRTWETETKGPEIQVYPLSSTGVRTTWAT